MHTHNYPLEKLTNYWYEAAVSGTHFDDLYTMHPIDHYNIIIIVSEDRHLRRTVRGSAFLQLVCLSRQWDGNIGCPDP
jgi:hypothetical protein